jgi:hypothetical protein
MARSLAGWTRPRGGLEKTFLATRQETATGVHTLLPSCSAAIVIGVGAEWQLLAARGPQDIAASFDEALAAQVRDSDVPAEHDGRLVAPFSSVTGHVLLVLVADEGLQLPERAFAIAQPLLDAGGILLDRALAVQDRDRAVRRVVLLCQERSGRQGRQLADLEHALTLLWPDSTASFYDQTALTGASWSCRRLIRTACDLDQTTISRRPVKAGLLGRDLRYQIAIPLREHGGALVVDVPAGGEELDTRSVAAAIAMTRESGQPVHPLLTGAHHA